MSVWQGKMAALGIKLGTIQRKVLENSPQLINIYNTTINQYLTSNKPLEALHILENYTGLSSNLGILITLTCARIKTDLFFSIPEKDQDPLEHFASFSNLQSFYKELTDSETRPSPYLANQQLLEARDSLLRIGELKPKMPGFENVVGIHNFWRSDLLLYGPSLSVKNFSPDFYREFVKLELSPLKPGEYFFEIPLLKGFCEMIVSADLKANPQLTRQDIMKGYICNGLLYTYLNEYLNKQPR